MKVIFNYATRQFESMEPTLRDRFQLGGRVNFQFGGGPEAQLAGSEAAKILTDAKRAKLVEYFKDLEKYIETNAAKYSDVDKFFKDAIKKFDTPKYKDFIIDSAQTQRNVRNPKPLGKIFDLKPAYKEGATFNYKNLFGLKGGDASSKVRYVKDMMLINMMEKNPKMINMRDNIIKVLNNDITDLSEEDIRNTKAFQKQNLKATAARPNLLRSYFNSIIKDFESKRIKVKDVSKGVEADLQKLLKKKDISEAFRKKVRTTLNNIYKSKKYAIELKNEFTKLFGKDKPVYAPIVKKGQESFEFEHKIGKASTAVNKLPATYTLRGTYVPSSFNYAKNINFDSKLLEFMNEYKKTKSAATETKIKNLYKDFNKKSAGYLNDLTIDFDRKAGSVIVTDKTPIFKIKNYDDYKQQFAKNLKHSQAYLSTVKGGKFAFDKKAANELMKKVLPVAGKITMGLGKVIKPLGIATGVAAVAQAANAGETNIVDLAGAYVTGDATTATTNRLLRTDEKFRNDYIANLPEIEGVETEVFDALQKEQDTKPVLTAGLKETFPGSNMDYLQAVQDGFQGSFEDFLQLQSIPQSDRPLTGELDLPEMDQTMMAAQGGRVGFANGSPNPMEEMETLKQAIASTKGGTKLKDQFLYDTSPIGELDKNIFGKDGDRNMIQQFNTQFLDPRSYPYYAQKTLRGGANIPELAVRFPLAAAYLFGKGSLALQTGDLSKFSMEDLRTAMEILEPKFTNLALEGKLGDALGLSPEAIQAVEEKRAPSQKATGDLLQFGAESVGPATPYFAVKALQKIFPKLPKQIKDLVGSTTAIDKVNKEIEKRTAIEGVDQTRRDILLATGAGGAVALLKLLGLDNLFKAAPKAVKATPKIVTQGGTPKYFFDFVSLIKSKGDDISETASTIERQKVYDYNGYTLTEELDTGKINIRKETEGGGSYSIGDGEYETIEGVMKVEEINYNPPETIINDKGKSVRVPDNYSEDIAVPDIDGGLGDVQPGLDSIDEVLELLAKDGKKYSLDELIEMGVSPDLIGDDFLLRILKDPSELKITEIRSKFDKKLDAIKKERSNKAGGGIMKMAGDDSGPPPKSGPTPDGLPYIAKNVRPIKERK